MHTSLHYPLLDDWNPHLLIDFDKLHYLISFYVASYDSIGKLCKDLCYSAETLVPETDQDRLHALKQVPFEDSEDSIMLLLIFFDELDISIEEVLVQYTQCFKEGNVFYQHATHLVSTLIQWNFPLLKMRYH